MAQFTALDDAILNFDPEAPQKRFLNAGLTAALKSATGRLPGAPAWPQGHAPIAAPLSAAPAESDDLTRFAGYDAVVVTWTSAEAATLGALFTPEYLPSRWYEYRHNINAWIPKVTGKNAPFNDQQPDMARYYHSLGLYFPCTIGQAKVLLFKSGLHLYYDGPATPVRDLMVEIATAVKPKLFITTGTGGAIGSDVKLGDVVVATTTRFDCTSIFKNEPWAQASYPTSALPVGAMARVTPDLTRANASRVPNGRSPPQYWVGDKTDVVVTTDGFCFDDTTDYYKLQGLGRACDMGDAMVGQALQAFPDIDWYSIRNASDPQMPNPTNNIEAAGEASKKIYSEWGGFTSAASVVASWAVIDARFNFGPTSGGDRMSTDSHVELAGSRRPLAKGAHRVRDIDPHAHIEATVVLKAPALPSIDTLPDKAVDPQTLTQKYGATAGDIDKVEKSLESHGVTIEGLTPSGRNLRISGTASAMEAAFKAGLGIYASPDQGEFRGREGPLYVPIEIKGLVETVLGLDQRRTARHHARGAGKVAAAPAVPKVNPLTPADLEAHYNFPPGNAAGEFVAIAEFGSPIGSSKFLQPAYFPTDVEAFCAQQNRPTPDIKTVPLGLAPLTLQQLQTLPPATQKAVLDETSEIMMDVEIVATLCSGASISVYYAPWSQDGWVNLVEEVTKDRPVSLSVSYGLAEDSTEWTPAALTAINNALQLAAMAGITVCVSSGDDGSGCDQTNQKAHVEFPSSSPAVLAVGGTMFFPAGAAQSEVVWWQSPGRRTGNGNSGATGGGVSVKFPRAAWQNVQIPSVNSRYDGRVVPDVSALAGPPFYALILLNRPAPNGGTSAAAPLWASLVARMNANLPVLKKQRFLAKLLYQNAASGQLIGSVGCTDITSGNNITQPVPGIGYTAKVGFDAASGWGVPNGQALQAAL
jgi:kumamolisin